jgi:RNA polymerase sigma-70 factor, ECF subfamily
LEDKAALEIDTYWDNDVELSKEGNKEAFSRIIRLNKISMYRVAKNILRNEQDIEDAIGDTILKAFMNIGTLKDCTRFKPWLLKILINQCYSHIRKGSRQVLVNELEESMGAYEENHQHFEIRQALASLEEDQRIVIVLFYYEDMSLKDISKTLNIPEGTVKSRLARAKAKLETLMKG